MVCPEAGKVEGADIGLAQGVVKIVPYCSSWNDHFRDEKEILCKLLDLHVLDIQHIGSTAVPGLSAKPIIDIMAGVRSLEDGLGCVEVLERQGYAFKGEAGIPGRLFFTKEQHDFRTHHLHMVEYHSEFWCNHLLFRDYLIKHPDTAKLYEQMKWELAQKHPFDREAYTDGKSDFIVEVLKCAKE